MMRSRGENILLSVLFLSLAVPLVGSVNNPVDAIQEHLPQEIAHKIMGYAGDASQLSRINDQIDELYVLLPDGALCSPEFHYGKTLLTGHNGVRVLSWSPDGKYIAVRTSDKTVAFWDVTASTWKTHPFVLRGHTDRVSSFAWSHDSGQILVGSCQGEVYVWNVSESGYTHTLHGDGNPVLALSMSPDGKYILAGSESSVAYIWDLATGHRVQEFRGHTKSVQAVTWSPDGTYIATGSDDGTVRIWGSATGVCIQSLRGHTGLVASLTWSLRGDDSTAGAGMHKTRTWETKEVSGFFTYLYFATCHPTDDTTLTIRCSTSSKQLASWSPDDRYVAAIARERRAITYMQQNKIWGTLISGWPSNTVGVNSIAWSPDGRSMAASFDDGKVCIGQRTLVRQLTDSEMATLYQAANGTAEQTLKVIMESDHMAQSEFRQENIVESTHRVRTVALSHDDRSLLIGFAGGVVNILNSRTGAYIWSLIHHAAEVVSAAWNSDDSLIAASFADNTVQIWHAGTGDLRNTLQEHGESVHSLSWCPDDRYLATGSPFEDTAYIWNVSGLLGFPACRAVLPRHTQGVHSIAWKDHDHVVTGSRDGTIRMWKYITESCIRTVQCGMGPMRTLRLSSDGNLLATDADDGVVRIWDTQTGRRINELRGHAGAVGALAWSPEKSHLAVGSDDKKMRIFTIATGICAHTLHGHTGPIRSIAWSSKGDRIATLSDDRTAHVWQRVLPEATQPKRLN